MLQGSPIAAPVTPEFDGPATLYFRPHDAKIGGERGLAMQVRSVRSGAGTTRVDGVLAVGGAPVELLLRDDVSVKADDNVVLTLTRASIFPRAAGGR